MMLDTRTRTVEQYEQARMAKLLAMAAVVAGFARRRGEPIVPKRPKPTIVDSDGRAYLSRQEAADAWLVNVNAIHKAVKHGTYCRGRRFRNYVHSTDRTCIIVQPGTRLVDERLPNGRRYATDAERIAAKRASTRNYMRRLRELRRNATNSHVLTHNAADADSSALQPRRAILTPEPTQTPSEGEETRQTGGKRERQAE